MKQELAEKRGRMSSYLEKMENLRLMENMENDRWHCAEEQQCGAKKEKKDMSAQHATSIENRTFAENLLMAEQERADDIAQELAVLQE